MSDLCCHCQKHVSTERPRTSSSLFLSHIVAEHKSVSLDDFHSDENEPLKAHLLSIITVVLVKVNMFMCLCYFITQPSSLKHSSQPS